MCVTLHPSPGVPDSNIDMLRSVFNESIIHSWFCSHPFALPACILYCLQALSVLSTLYLSVRLPQQSSCEKSGSQVCVSIQSTKVRDVYNN